jgi:hypothetical protein
MRFRLRTLLIVLALGPPVLAGCYAAFAYAGPEHTLIVAAFMAGLIAAGIGIIVANARGGST